MVNKWFIAPPKQDENHLHNYFSNNIENWVQNVGSLCTILVGVWYISSKLV